MNKPEFPIKNGICTREEIKIDNERIAKAKKAFFDKNRQNLAGVSKSSLIDAIIDLLWFASSQSLLDFDDIKDCIEDAVNQD